MQMNGLRALRSEGESWEARVKVRGKRTSSDMSASKKFVLLTCFSNRQALVGKSGPRQPMALFENALKAAQELRVRYVDEG